MQQRQPRLGDILDDYCPRERRVTNHAVVAMIGEDVKQTRCTTCDAEHDYKHAKVPRQRKKSDSPAALYAQVLAGGPKKVAHEPVVAAAPLATVDGRGDGRFAASLHDGPASHDAVEDGVLDDEDGEHDDEMVAHQADLLDEDALSASDDDDLQDSDEGARPMPAEEGPVHRRLIRAQLPRIEGQPPPARQAPEFTIRQPAGRINRFRPRGPRGAAGGGGQFQGPGNRTHGGNNPHGGPMRSGSQGHGSQGSGSQSGGSQGGGSQGAGSQGHGGSGRPPMVSRLAKRQGPGRKRSK